MAAQPITYVSYFTISYAKEKTRDGNGLATRWGRWPEAGGVTIWGVVLPRYLPCYLAVWRRGAAEG